ncbi:MAG: AI-2E family transporter [bacterium]|nr:AI-2E family transporter [bacterium]MCP4964383.1 AI-2E family transporter [bacterium]
MEEAPPQVESETPADQPAPDLSAIITRMGIVAWSMVGAAVLFWIGLQILARIDVLLAPIVLSVVLIYVLNPVVNWLVRRHIPRIISGFLAFLLMIGVVAALGAIVAPMVTDQASELTDRFPEVFEDSVVQIEDLVARFGFGDVDLWSYEQLQEFFRDPEAQDQILSVVWDRLGEVTTGLLEAILVFFLAPVVAFYIIIDLPRVREEAVSLVPERHKAEVVYVSRRLGGAIGGFLRGQVLVALIVGVMTSVGFRLIGLEFWLIIGMIAGFLNIIPFVGPWVGGFLGVLVGLVTADPATALWAAVVALVVQQLDNHLISPNVLRATVSLHPAVIILLIVLGGGVGGIWGVLLVVPIAAAAKILAGHFWRTRVLGQSWEDATEAMIESSQPPETLVEEIRESLHERSARTGDVSTPAAGDRDSGGGE